MLDCRQGDTPASTSNNHALTIEARQPQGGHVASGMVGMLLQALVKDPPSTYIKAMHHIGLCDARDEVE